MIGVSAMVFTYSDNYHHQPECDIELTDSRDICRKLAQEADRDRLEYLNNPADKKIKTDPLVMRAMIRQATKLLSRMLQQRDKLY